MSADFVGRKAELSVLEETCSSAKAKERPVAVLVSGPPGSGKTRLLAEFSSKLGDGRELRTAGYETATQVPLAAAADLLRVLSNVPAAGAMLSELLFAPTPTRHQSLEPLRIFEAARRALLGLNGLTLMIVDDLQWVDELSLALCSYLVRSAEIEQKALAVIAAGRPASAATVLRDSLVKELGGDRVRMVDLGPLERDEGVDLIRQLAQQTSRERAAELWARARGSPFWLVVLARSDETADIGDFLATRRRELGSDASRLLALLAVATRALSVSELAGVLAWDHTRTERAILELDRSGLAIAQGIAVGLAHDLIRDSVVADLSFPQRQEMHSLLASWLEQQASANAQSLHEALVHRREAGLDVTNLALRVLESPRRRLLAREGLKELARIADSADLGEPVATALRVSVAQLASELAEQPVALERWTALASSVFDPMLRARSYLAASRAALLIVERREDAFPLLELARSQVTQDPVLAVEIESHRANLLQVLKHRAEEGRAAAFLAAEKARQLWGNPPIEITSRERDAYVSALQVAFDSAVVEEDGATQLRIAEEMAAVARGSEEGMIWADHDLAAALMFAGRAAEAVDAARRAWNQARERMLPVVSLSAGANLASKLLDVGRLAEADEVVSECVELERRAAGGGERFAMAKVGNYAIHDLRHQIWLSRGDWRDAVASLEREVTLQPEPHFRMHLHWHIFVWLARCGDRTQSQMIDRHFAASRQDAQSAGCRRCARELVLKSAEVFARLGRLDDAEAQLQSWDEGGRPSLLNDSLWRRHISALVMAGKRESSAIAELEAVLAERKRLGLLGSLLWTRLDLGNVLLESDSQRSAAEFRRAGDEAAAIGASTEQQLAEVGLRRLGVRTWRRGRARVGEDPLSRLSERERQIASLIAYGNSNPEIAGSLFLSRKTVERHVSNILARTGARNRTELARLLSSPALHPTSR